MKCPACNEDMIVIEYRQIELDFCSNCSGLWFDSTELQLLMKTCGLAGENQNQFLLENMLKRVIHQSNLTVRKCPICNHKMTPVNAGQGKDIIVDVCPKNDGIWFDGGELLELIHQRSSYISDTPKDVSNVLNYLQETFKHIN